MEKQLDSPILALQKQRQLLQMEYEAEKEEFRQQTEQMGLQRKIKRGDVWFPLTVSKTYYNSLNQLVVEVFRTCDEEVEHNYEPGRSVAFFTIQSDGTALTGSTRQPSKLRYFPFTATVSYVDGDRMVVSLPDSAQLIDIQGSGQVGVQLFFDETSYRTMFQALDRVMRAKGRLGYLRDLF